MVQYILNKFHDLTKNRFWKYRESGNEILFIIVNFGMWLLTTILNNSARNELDKNDLYFLVAVLIFTWETILKEKR